MSQISSKLLSPAAITTSASLLSKSGAFIWHPHGEWHLDNIFFFLSLQTRLNEISFHLSLFTLIRSHIWSSGSHDSCQIVCWFLLLLLITCGLNIQAQTASCLCISYLKCKWFGWVAVGDVSLGSCTTLQQLRLLAGKQREHNWGPPHSRAQQCRRQSSARAGEVALFLDHGLSTSTSQSLILCINRLRRTAI